MENVNGSVHTLRENHSSSLFQNSCMGNSCEEESKVGERPKKADDVDDNGDARLTKKIHSEMGWVRKLEYLPVFTNEILDNHLI